MTRPFDLPPRWDGLPVEWDASWEALTARLNICKIDPQGSRSLLDDPEFLGVCPGCGMAEKTSTKAGHIAYRMGKQTRYRRLNAYRCIRCGHDEIVELTPNGPQCWDLDETDYTEQGSYERN